MKKSDKDKIIERVAWEFTNAKNKRTGKNYDIDALDNFGEFGLETIRRITEMFYYEFEKQNKILKNK